MHLDWQRNECSPGTILRSLREIGYIAYPFDSRRHDAQLERARATLFRQLFIAGLSMMQVMMYALPLYLATDGAISIAMSSLMRWAGLLLTLPAVLYSAQPFFLGAWRSLRNGVLSMDVPVALGILAAFSASVVATWRGVGLVYFDSITMFIFLLLCSRFLELSARRMAAAALHALHQALPAAALRLRGTDLQEGTELIAADQLRVDQLILVRPGDAVAADGVVVEGVSAIDVSLLTGESALQRIVAGDGVPGGAINTSQPLVLRVVRSAAESTLAVLVGLVEQAGLGKPRLAEWADRVAAWFVGALLLCALAAYLIWQVIDPAQAWPVVIALLVVACPCALSLATPTALAAATDRLVHQGVLIVRPHVLETLQRATHVVFDKTGTLTLGKPELQHLETFNGAVLSHCLQLAVALEGSSSHPLGIAITAAAKRITPTGMQAPVATEIRDFPGQGLAGSVDAQRYRLGSATFVAALAGPIPATAQTTDKTAVFLGTGLGLLARFDLADGLRPDAIAVVRALQDSGKSVMVLSGDRQVVTQCVADQLGITHALGDQRPEQKLAFVKQLQAHGAIVAMIGDGVNDAPVLGVADVSFAMGGGAALAQLHADAVLLSGRLSSLGEVADTARRTMRVIRQNLAWASIYNFVAIPAAALGMLNPWMSGLGMSVSSAVVVLNALRLRRRRKLPHPASGI